LFKTGVAILKDNKEIVKRMVKSGISHPCIAKYFKVSSGVVRLFCSKESIKSPMFVDQSPIRKKVLRMLSNDDPASFIHKETNVSYGVIRKLAIKNGYNYVRSYVPIETKTKLKIIRMLKTNHSSKQIRDTLNLTNISERQILSIKKKYKIKGLSRGGVSEIPPEETAYIKVLMNKSVPIIDMIGMMNKKFNKIFNRETIRGRCRKFGYKCSTFKKYDENEKTLMRDIIKRNCTLVEAMSFFPERSYNSVKRLREIVKASNNRERFKEAV
jgi:hypothetical protein